MQRNYLFFNLKPKCLSAEPNLNSNFDYTRNHTQKSNSKGTKKSPSDREEPVKRVDEKNVDGYMVRYLPWEKS